MWKSSRNMLLGNCLSKEIRPHLSIANTDYGDIAVVASSAVLQVSAHAAITPMLGLAGTPVRKDAQKPTTANPCGKAALTSIDTSKSVTADASGQFTVSITDFNA